MKHFELIQKEWLSEFVKYEKSSWFAKFMQGELTIEHYKWFLRETYFNARENPQLQTFATSFFKNEQRAVIRRFYQHAISEIGHDQLALNDLKALGEDIQQIPSQQPLPATAAFTAFGFYQVQFINPLTYLGYLFHLEFMPTRSGKRYIEILSKMGVPDSALTFLQEHATVDVAHNKLMEGYINTLITSKNELELVLWSVKAACNLHQKMLDSAFEEASKSSSVSKSFFSLAS